MSGRFILDTNIVIAIFNGETSIKEHLLKADEVFISSTVLGELFFGAFKSKRSKTNIKRISDFAYSISILMCDKDTAYQYGIVKNRLLEKGKPIPENDSFSLDPVAINRIFFRIYHCIFFWQRNSTFFRRLAENYNLYSKISATNPHCHEILGSI